MTAAENERPSLDLEELTALLVVQDGVVARRQLIELGAQEWDIRRMVRRWELHKVHVGVFVNRPGLLTSSQRRWAAVLAHWPAALVLESALPGHENDAVVHVGIAHGRTVQAMPGVEVHRIARLDERVRWNASPPSLAVEDAAVSVAMAQSDLLARFEALAKVFRSRRTTVDRLRREVMERPRVPDRSVLLDLLDDLAAGACSVLEREWLRVERAHGLPEADRQHRTMVGRRAAYVDASYLEQKVRVELDGREFHDGSSASWEGDHDRDLAAVSDDDELTVRLTYGQVFRHGCRTATRIAVILQRRGWTGEPSRCPHCPEMTDVR